MDDAGQDKPVCGDLYAKAFMDEKGLQIYQEFKEEINCNVSIVVRHRIIDDFLREALSATPDLCVVTIGAGFDSRPYRLTGGTWVELDYPEVISHKNKMLPVSDRVNLLHRIPVDLSSDSFAEKLSSFPFFKSVVFVIEGVFIYLDQDQIRRMLAVLHALFPHHKLICDLVTSDAVEHFGRTLSEKINRMGASFKTIENPKTVFITNGYRLERTISIIDRAVDFFETMAFPRFMLKCFLMPVAHSNAIYFFESH